MSDLLGLLAACIAPIAIGVIPALIAFVPPIRRAARQSILIRAALMVVCALISYSIMYAIVAHLQNDIAMVFGSVELSSGSFESYSQPSDEAEHARSLYPVAQRELWIRQMNPFTSEGACYTTSAECAAADELVAILARFDSIGGSLGTQRDLVTLFLLSTVPAAIGAGTVWLITRRPKQVQDVSLNAKESNSYA
jgi:hypothetical protein